MKIIDALDIQNKTRGLVLHTVRYLPKDVYHALEQAYKDETSKIAKDILYQLIKNADYAASTGLPLCQDTGTAVFFLEIGEQVCISPLGIQKDQVKGALLNYAVNQGMIEAYEKGYLRKSLRDPIDGQNTSDNSPSVIHTTVVAGNELKINFMAKGGGGENASQCRVFTPADGWQGIKAFIVRIIAEADANPCPPIIVGIGIGGTFDLAPVLAKKALLIPLDQKNPDPELDKMEKQLLKEINQLGIGPMGMGGKTSCLAVHISKHPCHIASIPVAVNVQCHSARHGQIIL